MNRRTFLSAFSAAAAAIAFDPERALWTPGKKLISIPKPKPITFRLNGADYLKVGDRFTMPVSYGRQLIRKQFVVTGVCTESGVITLDPATSPAVTEPRHIARR